MTIEETFARFEKYAGALWHGGRERFAGFGKIPAFNLLEGVLIPRKCLCAALEKGCVCVAYGTQFLSRPRIKGIRRFYFEEGKYPGPEDLASAISAARDSFRARDAAIVLSVPRPWTLVRVVELPAVVKENLASVIAYELDRLTPFNPTEAMYDFSVASEEDGKLSVIIIAMRAQTAEPYLEALAAKDMSPGRITTGLTGFGTLCGILGNGGHLALCMSVNDDGYEGCLTKEGVFLFGTSGDFPGQDREDNLALIREELVPMIARFEREGVPPVVLLRRSPGYADFEDRVGIPVKVITDDDLRNVFGTDPGDGLTGPLGGLVETIWPGTKGFNLASKGLQPAARNPITPVSYVLAGLIVLAMILYLIVPLQMEKAKLDKIEYQIGTRKAEVRTIEAMKQEAAAIEGDITVIRDFKESSPMSLDVMKELTTTLPKNVWLTRMRITGETVETEGYAGSATEMLPKLEHSNLFKKVEFTAPTIRDARQNADRFVMKMELEGFEKKKTGGPKGEIKK